MSAAAEVDEGERFAFGANWQKFLATLTEGQIRRAEESLRDMLQLTDLAGLTFLDIGSGSGLFSLAACNLGAEVRSLDYDPQSVACTRELQRRYHPGNVRWTVEAGSILDAQYLQAIPQHDIVYSWGVLHHTGDLWQALRNTFSLVKPGGKLFIAIYNDQGRASRRWLAVKRAYCGSPRFLRWMILLPCFLRLWGPTLLRDALRLRPLHSWRNYQSPRGMSPWRDVVDWVGGLPFEVARPEEVFHAARDAGFELRELRTCGGGPGCNEFVFVRSS